MASHDATLALAAHRPRIPFYSRRVISPFQPYSRGTTTVSVHSTQHSCKFAHPGECAPMLWLVQLLKERARFLRISAP